MSEQKVFIAAFPTQQNGVQRGMDLRDYFAAKAMQAIIGNDAAVSRINSASREFGDSAKDAVSLAAYSIADSMILVRSK